MIKNELKSLEEDILAWHNILNREGIWLFLATLGCWSVPEGWLRFSAFIIIVFFFVWRANSYRNDMRSFPHRFDELKQKITNEIEGETKRNELFDELQTLRKRNESLKGMKDAGPYVVSIVYWIVSFLYFLHILK
jgi:hypothetical protein